MNEYKNETKIFKNAPINLIKMLEKGELSSIITPYVGHYLFLFLVKLFAVEVCIIKPAMVKRPVSVYSIAFSNKYSASAVVGSESDGHLRCERFNFEFLKT